MYLRTYDAAISAINGSSKIHDLGWQMRQPYEWEMEGKVELKVKATCWNYIGTETASKPVEEEHENEEAPYK